MLMLVGLFVTWNAALMQAAGRPVAADTPAAFLQLTQQRFDANARNDRDFYERLLAPHFLLLQPHSFPAQTKKDYLEAEFAPNRPQRPKSAIRDFQARIDGDTATVSYQVDEPYPLGGDQPFEMRSRRLDTYVRVQGAWRLLSMAVAEQPSWPEVATIDHRLYAEYSGVYHVSPRTSVIITHESGHLMAQVTGQPRVELFPENATTFFDRTDSPLARTVFVRDVSGTVVAHVYRSQGQTVRAEKSK